MCKFIFFYYFSIKQCFLCAGWLFFLLFANCICYDVGVLICSVVCALGVFETCVVCNFIKIIKIKYLCNNDVVIDLLLLLFYM